MPNLPKRQCVCGAIVSGPCLECEKRQQRVYDKDRGSAKDRGYDSSWRKVRSLKLRKDPLCECARCKAAGITKAAVLVHHIKPIKAHPELRLTLSNLLSMAFDCHEIEEGRKSTELIDNV